MRNGEQNRSWFERAAWPRRRLAELASLPRAAVVVEERYSRVFALKHVRGGYVAELLARAQVRWPSVPIDFCETRPLAEADAAP